MSILDNILGQISGNDTVANLAAKVGLSPEHVESAIAALAKSEKGKPVSLLFRRGDWAQYALVRPAG